jgi:hypothetical protein
MHHFSSMKWAAAVFSFALLDPYSCAREPSTGSTQPASTAVGGGPTAEPVPVPVPAASTATDDQIGGVVASDGGFVGVPATPIGGVVGQTTPVASATPAASAGAIPPSQGAGAIPSSQGAGMNSPSGGAGVSSPSPGAGATSPSLGAGGTSPSPGAGAIPPSGGPGAVSPSPGAGVTR